MNTSKQRWIHFLILSCTGCVLFVSACQHPDILQMTLVLNGKGAADDFYENHETLPEPYLLIVDEWSGQISFLRNGQKENYSAKSIQSGSGPPGFIATDYQISQGDWTDVWTILLQRDGPLAFLMNLDTIYSGHKQSVAE